MASHIFWNRRSGIDRRVANDPFYEERRAVADRRAPDSDSYVLVVGRQGFDAFTLGMFVPIGILLLVAVVGLL